MQTKKMSGRRIPAVKKLFNMSKTILFQKRSIFRNIVYNLFMLST